MYRVFDVSHTVTYMYRVFEVSRLVPTFHAVVVDRLIFLIQPLFSPQELRVQLSRLVGRVVQLLESDAFAHLHLDNLAVQLA